MSTTQDSATESANTVSARLRGWPLVATISALFTTLLMAAIDGSIVNTATPRIIADLHGFSLYSAREDVTIAGTTIPRGEMVLAVVGSANRDPNYFDNPDTIDIARTNNRHLAFGQGIHYCLGAPLARLEGQIALYPHSSNACPISTWQISPRTCAGVAV